MDIHGRFDTRLESTPAAITSLLTAIDELKGRWTASNALHPQILGRLKQSVLITSTGASTRIEGARMGDEDIERLMKGLSTQRLRDRDIQEVKGYYELLAKVFDSWQSIKLTEGAIKHLHQELLKYGEKDMYHRGVYKIVENKVGAVDASGKVIGIIFDTTPVYLTPIEMQELVQWTQNALLKKCYHPLLVIGNFIIEFLKIHPFKDGNGRLSRLLANLLMLQAGYAYMPYVSHEKLIEDNKTDYYLALRKSQSTMKSSAGDITPWLVFFLQTIYEQSRRALVLLSKESIEQVLSVKQLAVWTFLQKKGTTTPAEIMTHTRIARSTVNQILRKLLEYKKIEKIGLGSGTRYKSI